MLSGEVKLYNIPNTKTLFDDSTKLNCFKHWPLFMFCLFFQVGLVGVSVDRTDSRPVLDDTDLRLQLFSKGNLVVNKWFQVCVPTNCVWEKGAERKWKGSDHRVASTLLAFQIPTCETNSKFVWADCFFTCVWNVLCWLCFQKRNIKRCDNVWRPFAACVHCLVEEGTGKKKRGWIERHSDISCTVWWALQPHTYWAGPIICGCEGHKPWLRHLTTTLGWCLPACQQRCPFSFLVPPAGRVVRAPRLIQHFVPCWTQMESIGPRWGGPGVGSGRQLKFWLVWPTNMYNNGKVNPQTTLLCCSDQPHWISWQTQ